MAYTNVTRDMALVKAESPPTWGFECYVDGEPNLGFFTNAPYDTPAWFSTANGRKARRFVNDFSGIRKIFPWDAHQIQCAADAIKNDCWDLRKLMLKPTSYFDLFFYWDSYDLWHMGVQNAWNILNHIYFEAQQDLPGLVQGAFLILGDWSREFLSNRNRRSKLFNWEPRGHMTHQTILEDVFEAKELHSLSGLDVWYLPIVQEIMFRAHVALRNGTYSPQPHLDARGDSDSANKNFTSAPLPVADKVRAMEKAHLKVVDEPPIHTQGKFIKNICIVDGTSETAGKVAKRNAVKNGADSAFGTSPVADKMLKAVSAANNDFSQAKPRAPGVQNITEGTKTSFEIQSGKELAAKHEAQPKTIDETKMIEELETSPGQKNSERVTEALQVSTTDESSVSSLVMQFAIAPLRRAASCMSFSKSSIVSEEDETQSCPGDFVEKSNPRHASFIPEPNREVFEDRPPSLESYPDNLDQGHPDNAPRKPPNGPADGPEMGRLDAVHNPVPPVNVLRQMYPEEAYPKPALGEGVIGDVGNRTHIPAFYRDLPYYQHLSGTQTYPSGVPRMNVPLSADKEPQFGASFQRQQYIPNDRLNGVTSSWPYGTDGDTLTLPNTSHYHGHLQIRNISELGSGDSGSNWQQITYDPTRGRILRHSPQRNQNIAANRQSYWKNGNSRNHEGRKHSHESRYKNSNASRYDQVPHGYEYTGYGDGHNVTFNPTFQNQQSSGPGIGLAFAGHRMGMAGHQIADAGIQNQSHLSRIGPSGSQKDCLDIASSSRPQPMSSGCKNYEQGASQLHPTRREYFPCSCEYCQTRDRTIYIGTFHRSELKADNFINELKSIFAQFGLVRNHRVVSFGKALELEYTSPEIAANAIRETNNKIIRLIPYPIRVTHPIGSQYFRPLPFNYNQRQFSTETGASSMHATRERANNSKSFKRKSSAPMGQTQLSLSASRTQVPGAYDPLLDPSTSQNSRNIAGVGDENVDNSAQREEMTVDIFTTPTTTREAVDRTGRADRTFAQRISEQFKKSVPDRHQILDVANNYAILDEENSAINTNVFQQQSLPTTVELVPEIQARNPENLVPGKDPLAGSEPKSTILQRRSYAAAVKGTDPAIVNSTTAERDTTSSESKIVTGLTSDTIIRKIGEVCASTSRQSSRTGSPTKHHDYQLAQSHISSMDQEPLSDNCQNSNEKSDRNSPIKQYHLNDDIGNDGEYFDPGTVIHRPNKAKDRGSLPFEWVSASVPLGNSHTRPILWQDNNESASPNSHGHSPLKPGKISKSKKKRRNAANRNGSQHQSTENLPAFTNHQSTFDVPSLQAPDP